MRAGGKISEEGGAQRHIQFVGHAPKYINHTSQLPALSCFLAVK